MPGVQRGWERSRLQGALVGLGAASGPCQCRRPAGDRLQCWRCCLWGKLVEGPRGLCVTFGNCAHLCSDLKIKALIKKGSCCLSAFVACRPCSCTVGKYSVLGQVVLGCQLVFVCLGFDLGLWFRGVLLVVLGPPCNLPALLQVCDGLHHVPCLLPGAGPRREARDGNAVPRAVQRPHQGAASVRHQRGKRRLLECLQCSCDTTRQIIIAKGAHNRLWSFCGFRTVAEGSLFLDEGCFERGLPVSTAQWVGPAPGPPGAARRSSR